MGGLMSRNKGKRAEREIKDLLQAWSDAVTTDLGREPLLVQRNTLQSDRGGSDLTGIPWLAVEVKHQETSNVAAWWKQTTDQAKVGKRTPLLFWRSNGRKWNVVLEMWLDAGDGESYWHVPATIGTDALEPWFKAKLRKHLIED